MAFSTERKNFKGPESFAPPRGKIGNDYREWEEGGGDVPESRGGGGVPPKVVAVIGTRREKKKEVARFPSEKAREPGPE